MNKLLRKIPLLVWAVLLSIISFYVVKENLITGFNSEQTKIFSGLLSFIGLILVAVNIQKQWKNERIKTEYLNQPNFILKGFGGEEFNESGPVLCPNSDQCTEDHWVDIIQTGNLAARDLKVALFHIDEAKVSIDISERWLSEERLGKDDDFQYKLPQFKIPISFFNKSKTTCFLLLMDYRSEYSGIRYKRIYQLCSISVMNEKNLKANDWKGRISFYSNSLISTTDTDSITLKEILLNYWFKFARWSKLKKDYPHEEWLINI
ncbi:hypothetical protein [Flavobacterium sp. HJSW_4]|uniref:hypothetical protein n=1 Tax=Flavobacterium sp. HJSW_4 TaxID=3344660 RepID=UPI0035F3BF68